MCPSDDCVSLQNETAVSQEDRLCVSAEPKSEEKSDVAGEFEFLHIAPKENLEGSELEKFKVYEAALDYAFKEPSIRSIAVIGSHASGKSSIVRSYFKEKGSIAGRWETLRRKGIKRKYKTPMYISLSEFESDDTGTQSPNEVSAKLESEIINQIVQRTKRTGRIRESRFQKLERPKRLRTIAKSIPIAIALLLLLCLIFSQPLLDWLDFTGVKKSLVDSIFALSSSDNMEEFRENDLPNIKTCLAISSFLLCLLLSIYLVYVVLRVVGQQRVLKGVSVPQFFNVEFNKNDDSYRTARERSVGFNTYLSEAVYLFRECGTKTFVFEDLERFHNVQIFMQLRTINHLLGSSSGAQSTPVKFIFLLNDTILFSEERTKFFDFIVPIVPLDPYAQFREKIKSAMGKVYEGPDELDEGCMELVSRYVGHLRGLYNLVNEFYVHMRVRKIDEGDKIQANEMLVLLAYRSIAPADFDAFANGAGLLHYALNDGKEELQKALGESSPGSCMMDILAPKGGDEQLPGRLREILKAQLDEIEPLDSSEDMPAYQKYAKEAKRERHVEFVLTALQKGYITEASSESVKWFYGEAPSINEAPANTSPMK